MGDEQSRPPGDRTGCQQFAEAEIAAEHDAACTGDRDDVVRSSEAEVLPQLVREGLGALQEERMPVVAGVGGFRRPVKGFRRSVVPSADTRSTVAPYARLWRIFAGEVDSGARIVALMPAAAAYAETDEPPFVQ
ncbi:hypothetical protein GCM10022222_53650 [Amycolatopsis ultiminotia]|uniref:Uncharacterized protein n=1 Tax=Amycolatopsis ultiminotia TaxID=543629 RepID=A0ABP6XAW4_9PSEU